MKHLLAAALAAAMAFNAAPALADTNIDTTTAGTTANINPFGVADTSTYGQTFTVGTDNKLNSFSLYLGGQPASAISFRAYVYAWNGSRADGPQLFASAIQSYAGASGQTEFAFATGGVQLASGSQYVAFLTTAGLQAGQPAAAATMPNAGPFPSDQLVGGDFVFFNAGDNFAALTTSNWDGVNRGFGDVWFKANLTDGAVPEPASWAMMIGGFGLLGAAARRRRATVAFA